MALIDVWKVLLADLRRTMSKKSLLLDPSNKLPVLNSFSRTSLANASVPPAKALAALMQLVTTATPSSWWTSWERPKRVNATTC
jgi:hypothetical protein